MMAVNTLKLFLLSGLVAILVSGCEKNTGGLGGTEIRTETLDAATSEVATDATDGAADLSLTESAPRETVAPARSVRLVDRDVEAPDDFQTTDKALWDGRPSLGGVWVAAADVTDPMRVIMRNPANGKFVIGALFRREADNPGPKLQISSDAADALGLVAGEPATIDVTALRRQEVPATAPDATRPLLDTSETLGTAATAAIAEPTTPDPVAESAQPPAETAAETAPPPGPSAGGAAIQIGIFSVEDNAKRAVATLAKAGITATLRKETSLGKPLWSVVATGNKALLAKIRQAGFADAYFL